MKVDNLILGAGIAGLACAKECDKKGINSIVFESENYYGGLCHSFEVNGFRFDSAVHLSFTANPEARKFFNLTTYTCHLPIAYNYYNSIWIKHPVINNMFPLIAEERAECIKSFIERKQYSHITNYDEWLRASYGDAITDKFYSKYTRKYWTVNTDELSTVWVGDRLNSPDISKILLGAFTDKTGNDYYANEMRYPKGNGGYETFLNPLLKNTDIRLNKRAIEIDTLSKYVRFSDGEVCYFNKLFSSIPLPDLVNITNNVPDELKEKASLLKASKISLVSIGFNKEYISKWLWFYIYDEDILAARVNSPSIKSKENVPKGCSSLQFEVYHKSDEIIDKDIIIENVKKTLIKMKICNLEDILFMDYRLLQYGNVIFYNGMEQIRDEIIEFYNQQKVKLIGRFGEWDYLWSDQSYLSGKNSV